MANPFIVGVAGGSGSGKTLFIQTLLGRFKSEEVVRLAQDNYYKPFAQQPLDEKGVENFDLPHSIDRDAFIRDLNKLIAGEAVQLQEYNYNNEGASSKLITLQPAPIILVEGIFTFYFKELYDLLNLKIFVDAPEFLMLKRRLMRDQNERGYDTEDVLYRYEHHVMPAFESYILPAKKNADVIIPNNVHFHRAVDMTAAYLKSILALGK